MTQIIFLIEQVATGIYLLCAIGVLINLRSLLIARRELSGAEFELERELGLRRQARATTWTLLLIEGMLAVFAISRVVAPTIRSDAAPAVGQNSPDAGIFVTQAPNQVTAVNTQGTPVGPGVLNDPLLTLTAQPADGGGPAILATPTISPTPPGTIIPGAPPVIGCTSPDAMLQVPANGQVLFESITVLGTAQTANFARYKFEISGPSTGNTFSTFEGEKTTAVTSPGSLGQLSLIAFEPGTYQFRLAVFDSTTQLKASCTVTVYLRRHPPTLTPSPTPIGGANP